MTSEYRALLDADAERAAAAAWELGREWESLGRWKDAETAYTELLRHHPAGSRQRDALFRRGFVRLRAGNREAALRDFRQCAAGSSGPAEVEQVAFWTARTLLSLGRGAEARSVAREAGDGEWPSEAYGVLLRDHYGVASAVLPGGSPPAGNEPHRESPVQPVGSPDERRAFERGMAYLRLGDLSAARAEFRVPAASSSASVHESLARVAAAYGLYPEGVLWANKALRTVADRDPRAPAIRRLAFPAAHAGQVVPAARREAIDPALVWALMRQESLYDARAVSRAGAIGLMQIMPATLARMNSEDGDGPFAADVLFLPRVNIDYGTRFLAERLAEFDGNLYPTLAGYNAGERKSREWLDRSGGDPEELFLECIGYAETYTYVRRIIWLRWMYHVLYKDDVGAASPDE